MEEKQLLYISKFIKTNYILRIFIMYIVCPLPQQTNNAHRVLSKQKSTVIINVAFSGSVPYLRDKNARVLHVTREHM